MRETRQEALPEREHEHADARDEPHERVALEQAPPAEQLEDEDADDDGEGDDLGALVGGVGEVRGRVHLTTPFSTATRASPRARAAGLARNSVTKIASRTL